MAGVFDFSKMNSTQKVIEIFKEKYPLNYRAFFKKKLDTPKGYSDIRKFQLSLACHNIIPEFINELDKCWFSIGIKLLKYNLPIYYLTPQFCEIVNNTILPSDDFTFDDFNYPFPAFVLALPESPSRQIFKSYVDFIAIGIIEKDEAILCSIRKHAIQNPFYKRICFLITSPDQIENFHIHYGVTDNSSDKIKVLLNFDNLPFVDQFNFNLPQVNNIILSQEEEKELPTKASNFAMKVVGILNAAPKLLPSELVNDSSNKLHHSISQFTYSKPIFIDTPKDSFIKSSLSEHHKSPIMHWRRGHLRKQHYGIKNELIKIIWIKSVLVNKI